MINVNHWVFVRTLGGAGGDVYFGISVAGFMGDDFWTGNEIK